MSSGKSRVKEIHKTVKEYYSSSFLKFIYVNT